MTMTRIRSIGLSLLGVLVLPTLFAQPKAVDGVLTDDGGMSLYWWDNDSPGTGKSVCNHACAATWPAFVAGPDSAPVGDFGLLGREDGRKQWMYRGRPLYSFVNDKKPGDRTGDGMRGNSWHLAKP